MNAIQDPFRYQREVSFFLRLHRHLPERVCGKSPLAPCEYRADGHAINELNDYVEELQKDPAFRAKEKEVEEAQKLGKSIRIPTPPEEKKLKE